MNVSSRVENALLLRGLGNQEFGVAIC